MENSPIFGRVDGWLCTFFTEPRWKIEEVELPKRSYYHVIINKMMARLFSHPVSVVQIVYKVGTVLVTNGVLIAISRVITLVAHFKGHL